MSATELRALYVVFMVDSFQAANTADRAIHEAKAELAAWHLKKLLDSSPKTV